MPVRTAQAEWQGTLRAGRGQMRFGGGAFEGQYSFGSRFEEGAGTNPEELIAAAHAGCFSMALSGELEKAGYPPQRIATTARVHIDKQGEGFRIMRIELATAVTAPGLNEETLRQQAEVAKKGCPVSQALGGVPEITVAASLQASD